MRKRLADAASDVGMEFDPDTENGRLALSLMFQESDFDDLDDDGDDDPAHPVDDGSAPSFGHATPSALLFWLHDEAGEKTKLSTDLAWYSIPGMRELLPGML